MLLKFVNICLLYNFFEWNTTSCFIFHNKFTNSDFACQRAFCTSLYSDVQSFVHNLLLFWEKVYSNIQNGFFFIRTLEIPPKHWVFYWRFEPSKLHPFRAILLVRLLTKLNTTNWFSLLTPASESIDCILTIGEHSTLILVCKTFIFILKPNCRPFRVAWPAAGHIGYRHCLLYTFSFLKRNIVGLRFMTASMEICNLHIK